jgi:hypothetical protein
MEGCFSVVRECIRSGCIFLTHTSPALKIQGIFGAIEENTCIAAFHVLYIRLRLATVVFS